MSKSLKISSLKLIRIRTPLITRVVVSFNGWGTFSVVTFFPLSLFKIFFFFSWYLSNSKDRRWNSTCVSLRFAASSAAIFIPITSTVSRHNPLSKPTSRSFTFDLICLILSLFGFIFFRFTSSTQRSNSTWLRELSAFICLFFSETSLSSTRYFSCLIKYLSRLILIFFKFFISSWDTLFSSGRLLFWVKLFLIFHHIPEQKFKLAWRSKLSKILVKI